MNILSNLRILQSTLEQVRPRELQEWAASALHVCKMTFAVSGKILVCGCGGSYCDAEHFCEELTGRLRSTHNRPAIAAMHLGGGGHLTCVANDFGFDHVYSRLVEAFGGKNDTLIVLSTSGLSAVILRAIDKALRKGMSIIALTGEGGLPYKYVGVGIITYKIPSKDPARIQEVMQFLLHSLAEGIEDLSYSPDEHKTTD